MHAHFTTAVRAGAALLLSMILPTCEFDSGGVPGPGPELAERCMKAAIRFKLADPFIVVSKENCSIRASRLGIEWRFFRVQPPGGPPIEKTEFDEMRVRFLDDQNWCVAEVFLTEATVKKTGFGMWQATHQLGEWIAVCSGDDFEVSTCAHEDGPGGVLTHTTEGVADCFFLPFFPEGELQSSFP